MDDAASGPSGPWRLPVARQHPDDEDGHARADEKRSRGRGGAGAEQTRHREHENDSDDELDRPMDRKGDHLDEAKRKACEKCHQEMDDREPPGDGRHVATETEEERPEKEDGNGREIEKAMETRVQKIHELIITRKGRAAGPEPGWSSRPFGIPRGDYPRRFGEETAAAALVDWDPGDLPIAPVLLDLPDIAPREALRQRAIAWSAKV